MHPRKTLLALCSQHAQLATGVVRPQVKKAEVKAYFHLEVSRDCVGPRALQCVGVARSLRTNHALTTSIRQKVLLVQMLRWKITRRSFDAWLYFRDIPMCQPSCSWKDTQRSSCTEVIPHTHNSPLKPKHHACGEPYNRRAVSTVNWQSCKMDGFCLA